MTGKISWLIAFLVLSLGLYKCAENQFQIDRCLDRGGRWNYDNGLCEGVREDP